MSTRLYVARDGDGCLAVFIGKPRWIKSCMWWEGRDELWLNKSYFPSVSPGKCVALKLVRVRMKPRRAKRGKP